MIKILAIIGARPQFIKHAPVLSALESGEWDIQLKTIHTGQHYDSKMSDVFFDELGMPKPDYMLEIGSHPHGKQTGMMMEGIEAICMDYRPDSVLVYGDTNSTLAGALVGSKLNTKVVHVEAGLRSFNRSMPEEINRIVTDHVSDILIAPTDRAVANLAAEGITKGVYKTGDIMLDLLKISLSSGLIEVSKSTDPYYLATIHRPYNTDNPARLNAIFETLDQLSLPVKCPLHPRTSKLANRYNIHMQNYSNVEWLPPVSYFENLQLMSSASAIITDSGGVQKEAYFLQKQCVTIRPETEWVETLEGGWNTLVFDQLDQIQNVLGSVPGHYREGLYGDGNARSELLTIISESVSSSST